jgi:hypothetical protein
MTDTVVVNTADWDGPALAEMPDGWVIVNAPRPLVGLQTWTGQCRHGIFYAAGPDDDGPVQRLWKADDAWPVVFTDNATIELTVLAKFAEYGYGSAEAAGVTVAEQAYSMGLPWSEATS